MRILQVTPGYYPVIGGVERHVQALAERLAARGHEVTVATMQPRTPLLAEEMHQGVRIRRFSAVGLGEAYRIPPHFDGFLSKSRNQWDIVHVHNYHAALIPLAALAGVCPLVVTTHLNDTPHSRAAALLHVPYSVIGRWAVRQAQAVICVTEAERERVTERLGVPPQRTVVIPNGVSDSLVRAGRAAGGRDAHLLLSVGRLQPYKRVEDAIAAVARLGAPYHLAVVGDGPHGAALKQVAQSLGAMDRVEFVGNVGDDELVSWYRRAGTVLSLSEAEAFGMTVLEGVAAGCQVVCSDIPAFRDLAGLFSTHVTAVGRRNPEAVASAVVAGGQRAALAPPADIDAFTWDAVTGRLLDVYRQVTGVVKKPADVDGQSISWQKARGGPGN